MREPEPDQVDPAGRSKPGKPSELHVASAADATVVKTREERLDAILRRADVRDRAAEVRDRAAEGRDPGDGGLQAAVDRDWAGRDRDRAAEDRADLLALLGRGEPSADPTGSDRPQH
jgi:hypothetical protein